MQKNKLGNLSESPITMYTKYVFHVNILINAVKYMDLSSSTGKKVERNSEGAFVVALRDWCVYSFVSCCNSLYGVWNVGHPRACISSLRQALHALLFLRGLFPQDIDTVPQQKCGRQTVASQCFAAFFPERPRRSTSSSEVVDED